MQAVCEPITDTNTGESVAPDRCPVCDAALTIARFDSGTILRWCEHDCWNRFEDASGAVRQESFK